jgi:hypothetical protein
MWDSVHNRSDARVSARAEGRGVPGGNAQLLEPAIDRRQFRSGLVNLLETGTLTPKDLKAVQAELAHRCVRQSDGDKHA